MMANDNGQPDEEISPLFSIIIPAYNAEKSIHRCLDSVNRLNGDDYEVIVVDDGSRDSTNRVVQGFRGKRHPLRLISQDNRGVYQARRSGCIEAKGEYCLFLDSDDRFEPGILDALRPALMHRPDMVVFNAYIKGGTLCSDGWLNSLNLSIARRESVAGSLMNPIWNKCIRREIFNRTPIKDGEGRLEYGEDAVQVASVLDCCDDVIGLDKPLYRYEVNYESVTNTIDPTRRFEQAVRKQEIIRPYLNKWIVGDEGVAGFNSNCLVYCADYCKALAEHGDYRLMMELSTSSFFTSALRSYNRANLTRNQKVLIGAMKSHSIFAIRLLCLVAQYMRRIR